MSDYDGTKEKLIARMKEIRAFGGAQQMQFKDEIIKNFRCLISNYTLTEKEFADMIDGLPVYGEMFHMMMVYPSHKWQA